ncbi:4Fe-4S binding protein [Mobilitalea sibirica]|uniref:4Fe-4S binding protein n=1 Tax=Mobilitalea sibirica TaxID=1462919 RepID=A0A8J7HDZ6_9FIRM|nr:4Fe-4S binding protein [Mobilitalea sibirica]MBH1941404.1 4Fe-4S binding protein [Mobilitalea sibirica]
MIRKIIQIDEELCNGCGLCVNACHEAAIALVEGKAKLLRDDYCDGLGNCLPVCPTNAISFIEREALPFNEEEVMRNQEMIKKALEEKKEKEQSDHKQDIPFSGCPGSRIRNMNHQAAAKTENAELNNTNEPAPSMLRQWPVQIQLVPVNAPYFDGADLLIAADCTAYAFGDFHRFMKNKITLIGCPKLDDADYANKFAAILSNNQIKSITVIRMEVPCCGGIVHAVKTAMLNSGQMIPWKVITISTDGTVLDEN